MKKGVKAYLNKKALSPVITTILIILLSIVAIGILWVAVRSLISTGSEEIALSRFSLDLSIKSAYIDGNEVKVNVRRSVGGGLLTGINFIFKNNTESKSIKKDAVLAQTEERTFSFTFVEIGILNPNLVSVAPIYESGGKDIIGEVTDTATIRSSLFIGGGNGGGSGGGGSGTGPPETGFCGDGIIQRPNSDLINEQCDGTNLGGQTCIGLGYSGGTLSCNAVCQFVTAQCIGGVPVSCNGTWDGVNEDSGIECDGTPLPYGCSSSCRCEAGFSPNNSGGCLLNPPLNNGTIFSVWPPGAIKYFDSEDLPVDVSRYIGSYTNFSNSSENRCFRITFAEYLELNGRSYLRTEFVVNISPGEKYYIWEAVNCGIPF